MFYLGYKVYAESMFGRLNVKKLSKEFTQFGTDLSLTVLAELMESLKPELLNRFTENEANLLIGQVVYWMFGRDIAQANAHSANQPDLSRVKDHVKPTAVEVLKNNAEYREIIVCFLRMRNTIYGSLYGTKYLKDPDYSAANEVLDIFGPEYKETPTQDTFILLVKDFYSKRPGELEQVEQARRSLS
jgi:hypothetical protein